MSPEEQEPVSLPVSASVAHLRRRKLEATQGLLGDTISISDEDWQQPSRLPGWTRAHVATHIARNADGIRRVVHGLLTHTPSLMYPDSRQRRRDLEAGSRRGALDLQIDLDTSAGQLNDTFSYLQESGSTEEVQVLPGLAMPVHHLMVARLNEVVLHRIDLDHGFSATDVDADIARWLLEWNCSRLGQRTDLPPLRILSSSGLQATVGRPAPEHEVPVDVHGTDAGLLGWLTGRGGPELVGGAERLGIQEL
ncbi:MULTISPECIES: maleylpyruvate isomerase family mycothiol-dependent enzyme [Luteococcus]|uniref:Maleylpyruvate isomerase, mycothiol-dependent n=1 Tax=Luteococcus japonicus LSP_Lj1 TaxID=1255658 RepID=A0A1R4KLT7_9ACTN|nr:MULTISPECIES: maleylpyruvate isomerase family mycothiol-dependent enzyme [Luteococcus]MDN5563431.1 maleylpyruvate isomerase family mycothiol-dependent enzyme [Luteococcus sp.]SJN45258.1 Maleylpyruvate isomerase, mycothiol-dependent [Luteococcus japonicus LSP_Lj1]